MDRVTPFLDWRQTKEIHHKQEVHNHVAGDLAPSVGLLGARVAQIEERIKAGASMADLQFVAQAAENALLKLQELEETIRKREEDISYLMKNAITDAMLKKETVQ